MPELRDRAEAGDLSAAEALDLYELFVPMAEAWVAALRALEAVQDPPSVAASACTLTDALSAQAAASGDPLMNAIFEKLAKRFPMLAAALQAKGHVREWTLGLELGVVFVKGQVTVTFDDGNATTTPAHGSAATS